MNQNVLARDIRDTNCILGRDSLQVVHNMFAGAHRDVQVSVLSEMFPAIHKGVADQRSPHNRWNSLGKKESPGLIVEVIPPTGAAIAPRSMLDKPLQDCPGLFVPVRISSLFIQADE